MKKSLLLALLLASLAPAARAQVFGQLGPAEILPVNSRLGGAYLNVSQDVIGALGQLRLSFFPNVDFGFVGGLSRLDLGATSKTSLRLAADVRFGAMKAGAGSPVDVSVGGGLGVETSDKLSVFRVGPSVVASHTFPFSSRSAVVPYVGAMFCFTNSDIGDHSKATFSMPIRFGTELRAIPGVRLVGEIQVRAGDDPDNDTSFNVGVNLPF